MLKVLFCIHVLLGFVSGKTKCLAGDCVIKHPGKHVIGMDMVVCIPLFILLLFI